MATGFVLGTSEDALKQQRANTLREIEARGGKGKAKNYTARLAEIDRALRTMRTNPAAPGATDPQGGTTPPVVGANDPAPLGTLPKTIDDVPTAMRAEKTVADAEAKGQLSYGNLATESNPFGTQTIGFDENGRPVSNQTLSPEQQQILQQQQGLSKMGADYASQIAQNGNLGQAFNPTLDPRITGGDMLKFKEGKQKELESYLTRDFQRDKARDLNDLETSLYNRGIPLDRQAEAYNRAIEGLNKDYDSKYAGAAAQALQFGGQEAQQAYNMNEGTIQNQLNQAAAIRGQNVSDVQNMSTLGSGLILPQFNQFQGAGYDLASPTEVQMGLTQAQQNAQKLKMDQKLTNAQVAAANRANSGGGRGGSVGNTGSTAQSPFVDM